MLKLPKADLSRITTSLTISISHGTNKTKRQHKKQIKRQHTEQIKRQIQNK